MCAKIGSVFNLKMAHREPRRRHGGPQREYSLCGFLRFSVVLCGRICRNSDDTSFHSRFRGGLFAQKENLVLETRGIFVTQPILCCPSQYRRPSTSRCKWK